MSLFVFAAGGALVAALVRRWCTRLGWRWIGGYWLLAGAFWAAPLTTSALEVPTDIPSPSLPCGELAAGAVVPANPLLGDVPLELIPFRALVRDRLLHGEAPLWSHEMGTGQPLLGDAISAPFSPFGLLALPLPPAPCSAPWLSRSRSSRSAGRCTRRACPPPGCPVWRSAWCGCAAAGAA